MGELIHLDVKGMDQEAEDIIRRGKERLGAEHGRA